MCLKVSLSRVLVHGRSAAMFVRMQEHVTNCRTSAQHAVASLLAPDTVEEYDYLPFFYSRVFNLSWQARPSPFRVFGSPPHAPASAGIG